MDRYGNDVYDMTLALMGVQLPTCLVYEDRDGDQAGRGWVGKLSGRRKGKYPFLCVLNQKLLLELYRPAS